MTVGESSSSKARPRDDEAGSGSSKVSRRRISHISKACNGCRRRKMKCDGGQPVCSICKAYKEDCVYNPEQDGRRSAPKAYVASLEERIRALEGVLSAHGIDEHTPMPESKPKDLGGGGSGSDRDGKAADQGGEGQDLDREGEHGRRGIALVNSGERLKMDESTGELLECGPTSLFSRRTAEGGDKSPASVLTPGSIGGNAVDRPAVLHPRPNSGPELASPELDALLHDEVLRLFFEYFNTQCFWVNEKGFRRDMATASVVEGTVIRGRRTAYYSPMLHNVVLSIGVLMLPVDKALRGQLALAFSKRGKNLIEEESDSPMMSTISALMLLGTYHAATSRQNLGFLYSGMGLRLVQALGLGTNCSYWVKNGSITEEQQMGRYHLFYAAYVLDKCWSTYVGRGASMTLSNYDIPVPEPDAEEDDILWHPTLQGPLLGSETCEPIKGWRSTTWAWTCRLAIIAERVLGTIYSIGFNTASANVRHVVSDLDVKLEKWLEEIPDVLRLPSTARGELPIVPSHILGLHAFHCFILILLHRPWFAQFRQASNGGAAASVAAHDAWAENSIEKCERAATKVVQIANMYGRCPGLRYSPITLNQIVFSAGTVHLLCATNSSGRKAKTSIEAVQQCITALEEMGDTLECAALSAQTLQGLLEESGNHAPPPKLAPPASSAVDVEQLLKDPTIADQLRKLGWAPPVPVAPAPPSPSLLITPQSIITAAPVTTQGPRGQGIDFDWFTTPLSYHPLTTGTAHSHAHAHGHGHGHAQTTLATVQAPGVTQDDPNHSDDHNRLANLLHASSTGTGIYDVLYAGAANQAFPSGNLWQWPFGNGDGGGDGGGPGGVP